MKTVSEKKILRASKKAAPALREPSRLMIAASENDADMLYATRFYVPDAFIYLAHGGRSTVLLSDLEVDRGRKQAAVDEVLSLTEFIKENKKALGAKPGLARVAAHFLRTRKVRRAQVPDSFPLSMGMEMVKGGVSVVPTKGQFWPARLHKTRQELDHLRRALAITAAGMARGIEVLAASKAAGGKKAAPGAELTWGATTLTSERLRAEIESAILHAGGVPANTIVAGGEQACDPHDRGSGPLRAGELIILDIFPRDARSGYYGDMTRTVVKGRASDAQRNLWLTVQEGQRATIAATRAGADGKAIHEGTKKFFKDRGYPTETRDGRHVGFFHGTGHGLGMQIHEPPRFQFTKSLEAGTVITIEPGLYYPGLGGVRIEDVVAVTRTGCDVLSDFEQRLEV